MIDGPPPDGRDLLGGLLVFRHLDDAGLDALAAAVEWLHVPAGARLFSIGDEPDGMYGLISGRVRFFADEDGRPLMTAEAGPGITFGEGSLLVGGGRSRTAVVVRDALLVRLPPELFTTLMATSPEIATRVAGMLAARIAFKYEPIADGSADETVLVGATDPADFDWFVDALRRVTGAPVVRTGELGAVRPPRAIVAVDSRDTADLARAVRQAERVLLVTTAREPSAHLARLRPVLQPDVDPLAAAPLELVLLSTSGRRAPAASWLSSHDFSHYHHVRRDSADDVGRVARHLSGQAVGLVLGGGGARGMAHIGVIKALAELGIPIDHVGGSSIGAIVGGQAAMGWTWDEMLAYDEREWTSRWLRFDLTVPTVSVSSGRRARRLLEDTFGSLAIEDFALPFFCTTVNLSRFRLAVHRQGPAARWIRASASAPGLWPPVVDDDGELHIDGGQLNNVPTDVMRHGHLGPIIAVDVCAVQSAMTVPGGVEPPVGIRHLLRRRFRHRFPSLVDTLSRCALLGSLQHRERAFEQADVYLTPDLATVGFSGFGRIREAVDIGYRTAMESLTGWRPGEVQEWTAPPLSGSSASSSGP